MMKEEYVCDECSKKFFSPSGLTEHKNVNHKGQKFQCEYCDKTFKSKIVLKSHVNIVHLNFRVTCAKSLLLQFLRLPIKILLSLAFLTVNCCQSNL